MFRTQHRITLVSIVALFIVPLLVACNGAEETVALPTRFVPPSPTATVPTDTPTPTDTPSATATFTATATSTATPTNTYTPTNTPTSTPLPATATLTPTFTPSPTFTSTPTETPSITPTPDLPLIRSFVPSAQVVDAGSGLTLSWESLNADTAQLEQLDANQAVVQTFSVTPNGQLPVTVPSTAGDVIYRLTVFRAGRMDTRSVVVTVEVTCPIPWFFNAPESAGCAFSAPVTFVGKYQSFQNGLMFNVFINGEDRVYGLNLSNNRYMVYLNTWDGTTLHTSGCGLAPAGLLDPQDVFNWMYHTQLGTNGLWCDAAGLGWATAPANLTMVQTYQFELTSPAFYINLPGFGIIRMSNDGGITGTWQRLAY